MYRYLKINGSRETLPEEMVTFMEPSRQRKIKGMTVNGFTAKKSRFRVSRTWFVVGVILLTISAVWWALMVWMLVDTGNWVAALSGALLFSAVPIGIGIYGIRRSSLKTEKVVLRMALKVRQRVLGKETALRTKE